MEKTRTPKKRFKLKPTIIIDIFSDTICPWCYIAKTKLQLAIDEIPNSSFNILPVGKFPFL